MPIAIMLAACSGDKSSATIQQKVSVAAAIDSTVTSASCASGATVDLSGELKLGGLTADLILRNNAKGTHEATEEADASAVLIPADQTLSIQVAGGQPVANPVLSVQFLDEDGNPVSAEIALGPCGGGTFTVNAQSTITATVSLDVDVAGCSNNPGPTITLTGGVTFGGLKEKLIVRDAGGTVVGSTTTDMQIVALGGGQTLSVPKQPVRGGVGGNPWIYAQLVSDGQPVSDEILVGRCVQLAGGGDEGDEPDGGEKD